MSFVDAHDFPVGLVLRVLGIPESTYHDWRARQVAPSRRELDDTALLEQIDPEFVPGPLAAALAVTR